MGVKELRQVITESVAASSMQSACPASSAAIRPCPNRHKRKHGTREPYPPGAGLIKHALMNPPHSWRVAQENSTTQSEAPNKLVQGREDVVRLVVSKVRHQRGLERRAENVGGISYRADSKIIKGLGFTPTCLDAPVKRVSALHFVNRSQSYP